MEIGKQIFKNRKVDILIDKKYKIKKELLLAYVFVMLGLISFMILPVLSINFPIPVVTFILLWFLNVFISLKLMVYIHEKTSEWLEKKASRILDEEVLGLLSEQEVEKYKIKALDLVTYANGFQFSESRQKLQIEKISENSEYLLFKDSSGNYKEVSVINFLSDEYIVC